jgi:N utilization substance protein B
MPDRSEPGRPRKGGHRRRRTARRMAVEVLYQADLTERRASEVAAEWRRSGRALPSYTEVLVAGVEGRRGEIDALLGSHAVGWPVHRMPVVDRNILRVGCFELLAGMPAAVAINEAVELAKALSTEDSGRFVNGVLGRIARERQQKPGAGAASADRA